MSGTDATKIIIEYDPDAEGWEQEDTDDDVLYLSVATRLQFNLVYAHVMASVDQIGELPNAGGDP